MAFLPSPTITGLGQASTPRSRPTQGLQNGFDALNDPLGANLRQRSLASVDAENEMNAAQDVGNPFADAIHRNQGNQIRLNEWNPQGFGPWLQALNEAAPGGIQSKGRRNDPMSGLPNAPLNSPSTMWQSGQTSSLPNVKPFQETLALDALRKVKR